jgi:glucokinase
MYAYFDIGGTKTRVAVSKDGTTLHGEPVKFDTPKDYETMISKVVETIHTLSGGVSVQVAGGGIAGPLVADKSGLAVAPNLPSDWVGRSVVQSLGDALHAPVYLENDSACVALGEAIYGAGKGSDVVAYITVSTGIGGMRIVRGKLDEGAYGFEPGHQYIDFDKSACPTCRSADAEDYCSGTSMEHRFNMKAYDVTDLAVWEELALWLAYMLHNTIVHWSPHVVVLGGSMMVGNPAIPIERVQYHVHRILTVFSQKPEIRLASLADMGGIYGAMAFVREQVQVTDTKWYTRFLQ